MSDEQPTEIERANRHEEICRSNDLCGTGHRPLYLAAMSALRSCREELAEAKAQTFDEAADIVYQHIYGAQNSPEEGTRYIYKLDLRKIFQRRASLLRTQKKP